MSTINLLPDDYHKKQAQMRANVLCVALFVIIMGGVAWASVISQEKHEQLQEDRAVVNAKYQQTQRVIQTLHDLEGRKKGMEKKANDTAGLMEKLPRSFLMARLVCECPEAIRLYGMEVYLTDKPGGRAGTKHAQVRRQMRGAGRSYMTEVVLSGFVKGGTDRDVANYLGALEALPFVARADLVQSSDARSEDHMIRKFLFKLAIAPGVDAIDYVGPADIARGEQRDTPSSAADGVKGLWQILTSNPKE
jgi:hypothetical protein